MSEFIDKAKEKAKAVVAAVDQELTVIEGVDGYDPTARERNHEYEREHDASAGSDEPA